jgi:hypothetical protein
VTVEPITHEVRVATNAEAAFSVYTGQIGEWWDRRLTANPDTLQTVTIETRVGGRVYAKHSDLGDHEWGVVTVCEPGHRLAHSFTLAQDPEHPTEVVVDFIADADEGSVVRFTHRGWTDSNAVDREKFTEWSTLLDRFAALADRNPGDFINRS